MKFILVLFLVLNSSSIFSKEGDEVRNGGGLAESYLTFALKNLGRTIDYCLLQAECGKKNDGRVILKKISASLANELDRDILKFSSDAQKPGFFIVDGYVRLAVTGNNVGNPIYYNLDLLYEKGEVKMNYGQAVQSLIHELGHHQGIFNHDLLELVGTEVRSSVEGSVSDVAFLPHLNKQGFFAVGTETKSFDTNGSLILLFKDLMVDLTPRFGDLLNACDSDERSADPLQSNALQFFNMHWNPATLASTSREMVLSGNVILYCKHKYLKQYRKFYEFSIGVNVFFGTYYGYKDSRFLTKPKFLFNMYKGTL